MTQYALDGHELEEVDTNAWETPPHLIDWILNETHLPNFTVDLCADKKNKKAPKFYSKDNSILTASSASFDCERCWMNPPYGGIYPYLAKAVDIWKKSLCDVVILMPMLAMQSERVNRLFGHSSLTWLLNDITAYIYPKRVTFHRDGAKARNTFPQAVLFFHLAQNGNGY